MDYNSQQDFELLPGQTATGLGMGMLWDKNIHGEYPDNLKTAWIIMDTLPVNNFNEDGVNEFLQYFVHNVKNENEASLSKIHEIYPNYSKIVRDNNYFTLDIYKIYCLDTWHTIGVKKTFWIKLIQRRWKKIYKERLNIINERKRISSLLYREKNGEWPSTLKILPSIKDIIDFA